jgi:hypothetical protein
VKALLAIALAATVTGTADTLLGWSAPWSVRTVLLVTAANGAQIVLGGWLQRQSARRTAETLR